MRPSLIVNPYSLLISASLSLLCFWKLWCKYSQTRHDVFFSKEKKVTEWKQWNWKVKQKTQRWARDDYNKNLLESTWAVDINSQLNKLSPSIDCNIFGHGTKTSQILCLSFMFFNFIRPEAVFWRMNSNCWVLERRQCPWMSSDWVSTFMAPCGAFSNMICASAAELSRQCLIQRLGNISVTYDPS